jgi:hypothetical protein
VSYTEIAMNRQDDREKLGMSQRINQFPDRIEETSLLLRLPKPVVNSRSVSRSPMERQYYMLNDGSLRRPAGKLTVTDDMIEAGRGHSRGKATG